jgi:hypothetical protein
MIRQPLRVLSHFHPMTPDTDASQWIVRLALRRPYTFVIAALPIVLRGW